MTLPRPTNRRLLLTCSLCCTLPAACSAQTTIEIAVEPVDQTPIEVRVEDMPEPYATESANKSAKVVEPPESPALHVPSGFAVNEFAEVEQARWLALTPAGEVLCASSRTNTIYLLADDDGDGVADRKEVFLDEEQGANIPFGMAFASGHFYLGNTDAVLRFPYERDGDQWQLGEPEQITPLPGGGYNQHWTRNVMVAPDGKKLYVTVGSKSNVDIEQPPRACVLRMNLDGSDREVVVSGIRNPVGLDFHPVSHEPYANVNERDGLGDNLVPDYLAHLEQGDFYGWPYAYMTPEHLDPRQVENGQSVRPDLAAKTKTPAVLYESHSAALGLAFYDKERFPEKYCNGAFTAFRGSWNRSQGTGYKIVFVPFGDDHRPLGHYEDFVTGFLLDPAGPTTWGRPVDVLVTPDGDLLFTEEGNGRIYRVSYAGEGN